MINGLEGIPGSGKSYEATRYHVLEALRQGRKVITNLPLLVEAYAAIDPTFRSLIELRYVPGNVRGTWDVSRMNPETGQGNAFELFSDGAVLPPVEGARLFGTVWCYWSDWKHPKTGQGPLFIVDECHVALPRVGTDKAVIEWFKLHRHFNADVLLATQRFRQMSQDIAELMAMVVKVRKADVIGKEGYIRKVHAGYRGAVIDESVRDYEPQFFALYRSHTQGNAVAESLATDVSPVSVRLRRWTRVSWVVAAALVAFAVYQWKKPAVPKGNPAGVAMVKADGSTDMERLRSITHKAPSPSDTAEKAPVGPSDVIAEPDLPEPYAGKSLHLTGVLRKKGGVVYTLVMASSGAVVASLTSAELVEAGYRWEPRSDCVGYLRWGKSVRAIVCDAPVRQVGSPDKPLVVNNGYGSDGRTPATGHASVSASQGMAPPLGGKL